MDQRLTEDKIKEMDQRSPEMVFWLVNVHSFWYTRAQIDAPYRLEAHYARNNTLQYVCLYVICMVITYSRVWINRVRSSILLVVSWRGKINIPLSPCVPENLVSRHGFSRPVPRQPAHLHTQTESGAYLRDSSRVPRRRPFMKPPYAIGSVPSLSGHAIAYRWRSLPRVRRRRVSKPQGKFRTGAALAGRHEPINIRLSFPQPLLVWSGHVESTSVSTYLCLKTVGGLLASRRVFCWLLFVFLFPFDQLRRKHPPIFL